MNSDLVIVGGGPAGSSLALFMAAHGWEVTVVDDDRYGGEGGSAGFKPGEGLIPAAKRILKDLGVWDGFLKQGHLPSYGNDSLWGSSQVQSTEFIRSIDGHGWRLDRLAFDHLLREAGLEVGVKYRKGFAEKVTRGEGLGMRNFKGEEAVAKGENAAGKGENAVTKSKEQWKIILRNGEELRCQWVADATGRSARIARQLGARRRDTDQLVAFYLHFTAGKAGDQYSSSLIESTPEGWWYNALLPSRQRVVYFFSDAGLPVIKQVQQRQGFLELLDKTEFVGQRLDKYAYEATGTPQAADARSACLDQIYGDGWLAVGDAALSFDPLSSQGIMTALYGGLRAGQALVEEEKKAELETELAGNDQGQKPDQGQNTSQGLAGYATAMQQVWDTYLTNRNKFYQTETRWASSEFWLSRLKNSH